MTNVAFNGRFLSSNPTGVHRVAEELIRGLDHLISKDAALARKIEAEVLCPKSINREFRCASFRQRTVGSLTWQFWEQLTLPRHTSGKLLVSLCNLAPIYKSNAITMIHDAQIFSSSGSYSKAFRIWYQFALPRIGRSSKKILTVSEFSRNSLIEWGIAPADKIVVIHNGVDHILRAVPDTSILDKLAVQRKEYAVALANTQEHKNVSVLLRAFSQSSLSDRKLVLFGAARREDFEAAGSPVHGNVIFAGTVNESELSGLLAGAKVMLFPSTTEGFGLPPLESMLLGTPVICAPRGALPEVCGDAAEYVEPDDVDGWCKAITKSFELSDVEQAERSAVSRAHAEKFTWDRAARQLADVIIETLQARGR